MKKIIGLLVLVLSSSSFASLLELNAGYLSDTLATSTTVTTTRTLYDIAIGIHMGNRRDYYMAVSVGSLASVDQAAATTTYTSQDTGLKFGMFFGRGKTWAWTLTYNFTSKVAYKAGAAAEVELRGTSIASDFGYNLWLSDSYFLAFRLKYYAPSLNEQVSAGALTTVAYTRTLITPTMNLYWEF